MKLTVRVKPQSRVSQLLPGAEGEPWTAWLKSPPVDGQANEELVALVARHFGRRKAQVRIRLGATSKLKTVEVEDDG